MILIFDLDDTLYPERRYVESGFRAVAQWGTTQFGWPASRSFTRMRDLLARHGRGRVFDLWLTAEGARPTRRLVNIALGVYRHHYPDIQLPKPNRRVLEQLAAASPLYVVTDGHKVVQARKITALGIAPLFSQIYLTHRYGLAAAKPSLFCFDLIRRREGVPWREIIYVGDNPAKDFINLKPLGATTIRVLTGHHSNDLATPDFDAQYQIPQLTHLPSLLKHIGPGKHTRN